MNSTVQMDFFPMLLPTSMYVEDAAKPNSQTEVFVMLFPGNMRSEYLLPSNSTGKNIHLDVVKTLKNTVNTKTAILIWQLHLRQYHFCFLYNFILLRP